MIILKRDGSKQAFDKQKIINAIHKAMNSPTGVYIEGQAEKIADKIETKIKTMDSKGKSATVQDIETDVFYDLIAEQNAATAKAYEAYRSIHEYQRKENTSDKNILNLIHGTDADLRDENSNKNAMILSTQRDLIAGEVSKDIAYRKLLPEDLAEADKNCAIHIHDLDYIMQEGMSNCCLVNLKDMLDNGTVINKCMVETPKSFQTACTITTQIIAQVASNQYGGQAINGIDRILAPYVRKSYERNLKFLEENDDTLHYMSGIDDSFDNEENLKHLAWDLTKREIRDGVQTIQYQLNTLQTTNGQAPFVTLFMYFKPDYEYAKEAAMIDEEILKQRIEGVKNEQGVYVAPAFPKLVYVLDKHNVHQDSPYYYLTKLAAECTSKRMYPDYVSAKVMKETHEGQIYSPMGCVAPDSVITYQINGYIRNESIEKAWGVLKDKYNVIKNIEGEEVYCTNELISSQGNLVPLFRMIRKKAKNWLKVTFDDNRSVVVTLDHVFRLVNGKDILAKDLKLDDKIPFVPIEGKNINQGVVIKIEPLKFDAWAYDVTTENELFDVDGIVSHNCRSFLSLWKDENGEYKFDGRFNCGVVSLNIPQIAIIAKGNQKTFDDLLQKRLGLVKKALLFRHNSMKGSPSDIAPILWQDGAYARLQPGEKIDKYLEHGYSTLSVGYIGLYEACLLMTGESNTTPKGHQWALDTLQKIRDAADKWKAETDLGFSVYGSPRNFSWAA